MRWTAATGLRGEGRRALVVGAGLGFDAEHLAALGFATTAFDVAPTAVAMARERAPGSAVDYRVADLLDLPREWDGAFDLVVEIITVQALPEELRAPATAAIASTVAPGGTLFVVSGSGTARRSPARRGRSRASRWRRSRRTGSSSPRSSACRCPTRPRSGAGRRCSAGPPTSATAAAGTTPSWRCGSRTTR